MQRSLQEVNQNSGILNLENRSGTSSGISRQQAAKQPFEVGSSCLSEKVNQVIDLSTVLGESQAGK